MSELFLAMASRLNMSCRAGAKSPTGRDLPADVDTPTGLTESSARRQGAGVTSKLLPLAFPVFFATSALGAELTLHSFRKQHLESYYWSEGAMLGDLNR